MAEVIPHLARQARDQSCRISVGPACGVHFRVLVISWTITPRTRKVDKSLGTGIRSQHNSLDRCEVASGSQFDCSGQLASGPSAQPSPFVWAPCLLAGT